jgi:NACHT domain
MGSAAHPASAYSGLLRRRLRCRGTSGTICRVAWAGWWRWAAATIVLLFLGVSVTVAWFIGGLEGAAALATVLALLPTVWVAFGWALGNRQQSTVSTPEQVDTATRILGSLVEQQWRKEVRIRQLTDPSPLSVRWKPADQELGDHRWLSGTLSGRTDDIRHLTQAFRRLPQQRLVILGGPGTGKTTLAVLLTLALCEKRSDRDPVPVLLTPGSWDPAHEQVSSWITRRLAEDYPALRASAVGPTAIESLVAGRRLLPVIDGLDELPEGSARRALMRIGRALADGDPLIVTCRTMEYRQMVVASDVITAAAVVEAQDVTRRDVLAYLTEAIPPGKRPQWQPVLEHLRSNGASALADALSTPLMVWLLRAVFVDGPADPAELINNQLFPDKASIETYLVDMMVPTVLTITGFEQPALNAGWDATLSQRWLSFIAVHLRRMDTPDFLWWHLSQQLSIGVWRLVFGLCGGLWGVVFGGIPTQYWNLLLYYSGSSDPPNWVTYVLLSGIVNGLVYGTVFGVAFALSLRYTATPAVKVPRTRQRLLLNQIALGSVLWLGIWFLSGLATGFHFGITGVLLAAIAVARGIGIGTDPTRANWSIRGRKLPLLRALAIGLVLGGEVGIVAGVIFGSGALLVGWLELGLGVGLVYGFMTWLQAPSIYDGGATPLSTFRSARTLILTMQSLFVVLLILMDGLVYGLISPTLISPAPVLFPPSTTHIPGPLVGVGEGLLDGLVYGPVVALVCGLLPGNWIPYAITNASLAMRGQLPWRLMAFLEHCHRLGILRQVGPVYQFRHARLQDHLAQKAAGTRHLP